MSKPKFCTECEYCEIEQASGGLFIQINDHLFEERDCNIYCTYNFGKVLIASIDEGDKNPIPPADCPLSSNKSPEEYPLYK
jgi:hypothetical protein